MLEITIIGNVGADPKVITGGKKPFISFDVCHAYGTKENPKQTWVACVWFFNEADKAEQMAKFIHRGDQIYIAGRPEAKYWQTKDGDHKAELNCVVERVQFLINKKTVS